MKTGITPQVNVSSNITNINNTFKNSIKSIITSSKINYFTIIVTLFPKIQEKLLTLDLIKNKPILSLKPFTTIVYTEESKQNNFICKKDKELKEIFDGMYNFIYFI